MPSTSHQTAGNSRIFTIGVCPRIRMGRGYRARLASASRRRCHCTSLTTSNAAIAAQPPGALWVPAAPGTHSPPGSAKAPGGLLCKQLTTRAALFWNLGDGNQHGILNGSVCFLLIPESRIEKSPDKTAPCARHGPGPSLISMICMQFGKAGLSGRLASLFFRVP